MSKISHFTLRDLLLSLRRSLLNARERQDRKILLDLTITFGRLVEEAYGSKDETMIGILVTLEDAARDGAMGVNWKSVVPSEQLIEEATRT